MKIHQLRTFLLFNPCFVMAGFLAVAIAACWEPKRPKVGFDPERTVEVRGWIARPPQWLENCLYVEIEPLSLQRGPLKISYPARLAVYIYTSRSRIEAPFHPPLGYGEVVRFESFLEEPSYYAIPGVADSRDSFWRRGLLHQVRLKSAVQVSRCAEPFQGCLLFVPIFTYADAFEIFCYKTFNSDNLKLILALFLGRKNVLDESDKNRIGHLGIFHLFVVSGFHVSALAVIFHLLLRCWGIPGRLLTVAAVWAYVILVGCQPPVLRAVLMTTVFYLLLSFGLSRQFLNGLGIAALVILIISPISLFSPSFQFSFLCLSAIGVFVLPWSTSIQNLRRGMTECFTGRVAVNRDSDSRFRRRVRFFLEEKLQFWPRWSVRFALPLTGRLSGYFLSLACCGGFVQLFTLPLSLYYSNLWIWTQFFSNLVLIPLFALFLPFCLGLFLTFWLPLNSILASILGLYADLLRGAMSQLERFAFIDYVRHPEPAELAAYFLVVLGVHLLPRQGFSRYLRLLAFLSPVLLLIFSRQAADHPPGQLQITMLDVGQGESIHLRYPDGSDALIDTGGFLSLGAISSQRMGKRLISRYLWTERSRRLRYVLLTHSHADHTQGYDFIKRAFPIERLYFHDFQEEYRESPARRLSAGDRFFIAGVEHLVLNVREHR